MKVIGRVAFPTSSVYSSSVTHQPLASSLEVDMDIEGNLSLFPLKSMPGPKQHLSHSKHSNTSKHSNKNM